MVSATLLCIGIVVFCWTLVEAVQQSTHTSPGIRKAISSQDMPLYSPIIRSTRLFCRRATGHMSANSMASVATVSFPPASNVQQAYDTAKVFFQQQALPDAEESARHLLQHAAQLGTRYSEFQSQLHVILPDTCLQTFKLYCEQRVQRLPIQYIIGNWDFYGMTFLCKPPILIPRPETEELVEHVLTSTWLKESLKRKAQTGIRVLDIGAGTGAIGIALAKHLPATSQVFAIDINPTAVALANENAVRLLGGNTSLRYRCVESSFQDFVKSSSDQFDIIVSNPPYIPSREIPTLQDEVNRYEDHVALDGGEDGLDIVRDIVEQSDRLMLPQAEMWLEVSTEHPDMIEQKLKTSLDSNSKREYSGKLTFLQSFRDLSGKPRFVKLKKTL